MSEFRITIAKKGLREETVRNILKKEFDTFFTIEKIEKIESRSDRLSVAESSVQEAISIVEELADELQNWKDGLPENLQNGEKADQLDSAIDALQSLNDELQNADFGQVEFPGMY